MPWVNEKPHSMFRWSLTSWVFPYCSTIKFHSSIPLSFIP